MAMNNFSRGSCTQRCNGCCGVVPVLLLLLSLALGGCSKDNADQAAPTQDSAVDSGSAGYRLVRIDARPVPDMVRGMGMVHAFRDVEVSAEISGKVQSVTADVGDVVITGSILAQLDNETRVIAVEKSSALLQKAGAAKQKARKDSGKSRTLFRDGVISDSESDGTHLGLQVADADLALARAELKAARRQLRDTRIAAPFGGMIAGKDVEVGALVTPGQRMFTLVDIAVIKIRMRVAELDIVKLSVGDMAEVLVDSFTGEVFRGRLKTIGVKADAATRTYPLEIEVDNAQGKLLPGMVARVTVQAAEPRKALFVPRESLRRINDMQAVTVMDNGTLSQRIVYVGQEAGEQIEVARGLAEGEMVVIFEKQPNLGVQK
ncbi:MAG: efflux RND transporter periplasmic adaptor subunit [Deltaproteobacteria bacterium]|nr:efflux RND transporter periplasmic adaptor subunit [Deltaproteobacteria bacterium]